MKKLMTIFTALVLGTSAFAQIPTNGLLGYWPFNGNANDESVNGHNGIVNNGVSLTSDRFGNNNSAMNFPNYTTTSSSNVDLGSNLNPASFTISIWYYETQRKDFSVLFSNYTGNSGLEVRPDAIVFNKGSSDADVQNSNSNIFNTWKHIVATYDGSTGKMYIDNILIGSVQTTYNPGSSKTLVGDRPLGQVWEFNWQGKIDDIRIYNHALTQSEVTLLYQENMCSNSIVNDTTTYHVSDIEFAAISPKTVFVKTDSLITQIGGCDSIVNRYAKFVSNPTYCSVTDTLIIDVTLTGVSAPNNTNTIKVYPNPAKDFVIINTGNYASMSNYSLKIENTLGQTVYTTAINQAEFQVNVNSFGGLGVYFVKISDNTSNVVSTKKIILQ